jgi:hypothetical protein
MGYDRIVGVRASGDDRSDRGRRRPEPASSDKTADRRSRLPTGAPGAPAAARLPR